MFGLLVQCRASYRKVAGSMPVLSNRLLCPWERHLTLISLQALCVVWKTAQVFVLQRHIPEKQKLKTKYKRSGHGTASISESGSGSQLLYA